NTLGSSADIGKSHEVPHSFHNKYIVVEEFVNHVGNNQNFDCSTGPEQMMDKDIHNERHSHMIRKSTSGTRAVEGNRNNLEYCHNNSDKDNIVDKLRPTNKIARKEEKTAVFDDSSITYADALSINSNAN
ncbi:hypothetical protein Tco_1112703, partial [Tanacetum coccineum]